MPELVKGWDAPVVTATADAQGVVNAPGHCAATLAACLDNFRKLGDWNEGDVAITTDVYHGSSHPTELTAATPVMQAGRITGWKLARTQLPDLGGWELGCYSPRAMDIWAEAARIVPAKAFLKGQPRREVLELLELNSRTPKGNRAIVTALCRKLISGQFQAGTGVEATHTQDRDGEAVLRAPGVDPLTIKVRVRKAGERVSVSFPDLPPPSAAPLNATRAMTLDALSSVLGVSYRLIEVDLADETLVTATRRRPVAWARALLGEALSNALGGKKPFHNRDPHFDPQTGRLNAARAQYIQTWERGL
jgi:N-methylhydantoinase B/oxoprolinase/acetone carboxylase alpha subunit